MAYRSGLAAQFMIGEESTPGVAVTPTVSIPIIDESLTAERMRIRSASQRSGRATIDSEQWSVGHQIVSGPVGFELTNRSLTKVWKHCLGTVSTGSPTGDFYPHTFTPGDLAGLGLTMQPGRPTVGGTTVPFTYSGCKIASWELACSVGEVATFGIDVAGIREQVGSRVVTDGVTTNTDATVESENANFTQADVGKSISGTGIPTGAYIASVTDENTIEISAAATATGTGVSITIGTALASPSYSADILPMTYVGGSITVAGSSVGVVNALTVGGNNGLKTDRIGIGNKVASEHHVAAMREFTFSLDAEFNGTTDLDRYARGDEFAVVLSFTDPVGTSSAVVTLNAAYENVNQAINGPDILSQTLEGFAVGDGSDADAITVVVTNKDSAA